MFVIRSLGDIRGEVNSVVGCRCKASHCSAANTEPSATPSEGFLMPQAIRSIARSAASTRPPPAQGSLRMVTFVRNKARSKINERFAQWRESFVYLYIAFRGLLNTALRDQYGTALTPGGRWLRPHRQSGIASNRRMANTLRLLAVDAKQVIAPPRARGRRPRRAVEERFCPHEIKSAQR